ncbi:MAG: flavodoxin family protein, partial [Methanosarcinaceae archaeon]|nr:flavodoxin family protein [Methanosarcinaceae archaeon]
EKGEYGHVKRFDKVPDLAVISNCGLPGQSNFQVQSLFFRRLARSLHTEVIAEVYRDEGEIFRGKDNMLLKPLLSKYRKLLRSAGRELVERQVISEKLREALEKPIVPPSIYIKFGNEEWDRLIKENKLA